MQLTRDHYTVAWLCALPRSELLAAVCSLDQEHDPPELQMEDFNNYHYGSIKGHNIVIACMPPEDPGTVSANSLVHSMRINFHNLKIHMFVGIGGGVPYNPPRQDPESDIHLGDVVIGWSEEVGGPAIVQYDLGRNRETDFQMTSHFDRPGRGLTTAFGTILMTHRRGRTKFHEHLNYLITQHSGFAHPGLSEDRLFKTDCLHGNAEDCSSCPKSGLVDRSPRKDTKLVFHQSTIASGNSVIKNASERDRISALCQNARCFEMEAAGVMNEIRPLVIRGIADYADGHKNWKWHDYAAATAAVFAKEFLCTITPIAVKGVKTIAPESDFDPSEILQSLQPFINNPRFNTVSEPFESTYNWIWHTKEQNGPGFVEWLSEDYAQTPYDRRIFWIRGKPGSGKSTLMKNIAHTLEDQHENNGIIPDLRLNHPHVKSSRFFFSRLGSGEEQRFESFLLACLAQICHAYPGLVHLISNVYAGFTRRANSESKPEWTEAATKEALGIIGRQRTLKGSIVLQIDGLDECTGNMNQHLEYLTTFIKSNSQRGTLEIKACIASREPDIQRWLHRFPGFTMHERTASDILQYVSGNLAGSAVDSLQLSTIEQLKKDITHKAEGVFIWVKVVVQEILMQAWSGETDEELMTTLSKLPSDIMDLYDVMVSIIERSGYLNDAALWLGVLYAASELEDDMIPVTPTLIDMSYIYDGPDYALNEIANCSSQKDMITIAIGMERKLRNRCRDLIQTSEHSLYGWKEIRILPVHERYCLLIHGTFREYMRTQSWQNRMLRLGNAANEEKIQVSLMTMHLRRVQQDPRMNYLDSRNIFAHARLYEFASGSAATQFLESLDKTTKVLESTWCCDLLVSEAWELISLPKSYLYRLYFKGADIFSIAVKYSVRLFVEENLQGIKLCDLQQPLLHIVFGVFCKSPLESPKILETLLQNGFPVNATMPNPTDEPDKYQCYNVLDTILLEGEFSMCHENWYSSIVLLLKYGANVSGTYKCLHHRYTENRVLDRFQNLILAIMIITDDGGGEEIEEKRKGLVRTVLQIGGDPCFCKNHGLNYCLVKQNSYTRIAWPEMNQVVDDVISELDSSDPDWRITAKDEGIRRAENAAKEAARWEKIWKQRYQAWKIMWNQGFFANDDESGLF